MKEARSIISHISNNPLFYNLKKAESYKKLISFFPLSIKEGISFMYNKNDTLFIAFIHQGYWMEFNNFQRKYQMEYRENYIKKTLKQLILLDPSCECIWAEKIKFFYMDNSFEKEKKETNSLPLFLEQSNGKFKNRSKDKKLHKLFEDIREIICSNKT